ncbi:Probable ATP-dependent helicase dinG homolog [Ralstonia mannitolilytica]|uniref:Probable ATP-dependent helicase dinG homolog n=1 Tax=Ralstonia mannitolilytica TaxID=105219 RepID=A0AAJ4ZKN4_9RALS|nr:ATP-dependent DNA helicase [Ralstonia mannitolilytica]CAG2138099.1 putative ATP-dependent DNA helicase YoaA [Ralstonia mannitolilytica]CAJ0725436.1 putative ATP-dependent DNA helicase YoaA [Ralstonia mannitolilytica]SUD87541.1 Probable ATP-dependent helicase dinG homolog [Ralstonia mannitolilytica]SUD93460.1 Probable ATP-dependent helicase dinG homolog [Ralstonia mannitolilytica]
MRPRSFHPQGFPLTSLSPLAEPSAESDAGEAATPKPTPDAHHAELATLFADDGTLAKGIESYRPRTSQLKMAQAVANAIEAADSVIVEAGTGTGKTYAYLVPAMLWGGKVILSTGTKNLQDQLFLRDIPTVRKALNAPVSVALLKGRANYVCHYHLERTSQNGRLSSRQDAAWLRQINLFLKTTKTGDKAELASVPENAPVWNLVTSTRDNCLGSDCAYYKDCFVMRARKEAQQADVVVVNHHLFFADVMLKDTGMAELLPAANTIIFDEAHQLPETATLFFGDTISTNQILELARDSVAEGLSHARDAVDWVAIAAPLERAARDLRLVFRQDGARLSMKQIDSDAAIAKPFYEVLPKLEQALSDFTGALEAQAERAETIEQCHRRAVALCEKLEAWVDPKPPQAPKGEGEEAEAAPPADERVRWVEVFANSVQLHLTPLSIAPIFSRQRAGQPRAWIFTSATLSVRGNFTHYAAQLGLDRNRSLTLDSPFDYASQGLLYVPRDLPQPSDPRFTDAVLDAALPMIEAAGGKTFLLCTTLRAVNRAAERLADEFAQRGWDFPLLVQGQASRTELLDRFRALGNAVLIGSQSFWEGVDVRGEALSLVVIDKLPFAPPDDPVLSARMEALEKKGLSPFAVHQLPHAVITLKQGAGRLIRSETDRGVLMICDPRLVEKSYGRQIWQSLPPFKRTREAETAAGFLRSLRPDVSSEAAAGEA